MTRLGGISAVLVAVSVLSCINGCKKSDENVTYKSFKGSINLSLNEYQLEGDTKEFFVDSLAKLITDDGAGIGYYVKLPLAEKSDTLKTQNGDWKVKRFTVTAPDSLNTFETSFSGYSAGYYTASATQYITVVRKGLNGNSSLTEFDIDEEDGILLDERDGREYYTTVCGNTEWMRQNLAWKGAGLPYKYCPAVDDVFGMFYSWEDAQTACPDGWRLPSDSDWLNLAAVMGVEAKPDSDIQGLAGKLMCNVRFNREKMWSYWRSVKVTDESGLSVLPTGYAQKGAVDFDFSGLFSYALLWCSDMVEDAGSFRYIYEDQDILYFGLGDRNSMLASVRCVRTLTDQQ